MTHKTDLVSRVEAGSGESPKHDRREEKGTREAGQSLQKGVLFSTSQPAHTPAPHLACLPSPLLLPYYVASLAAPASVRATVMTPKESEAPLSKTRN